MSTRGPRRPAAWLVVAFLPVATAASQDPGQPVTRQEIEDLKRQLVQETRSSLELQFDGRGETGDLNDELAFRRYGARVNLRLNPETTFHLAVHRTPYRSGDGVLESSATGVTAGVRSRPSERREWGVDLSGTRFEDGEWSLTGLASLTLKPSESLRYTVSAQRSNVEESILSVAGLRPSRGPFAGDLVGAVRDNRLVAALAYRLPARMDLFAEAGVGSRSGSRVDGNLFTRAGAGLGFAAVARGEQSALSLLRLSASFDYFGFDEDRLGYGGASLVDRRGQRVPLELVGSDGISPLPSESNPGIGGYFSPSRFDSRVLRAEARGRASPSVDYAAAAFVGSQSFTGASRRRARGVSASVTFRFSERLSLPATYAWDDFGPFAQQSFLARLVILF